jgi:DNA-binding transcriptional ArsR family regulator
MAERIFEALGDSTRRQILEVLASGERSAGAVVEMIQRRLQISQPAVSQHLKVLRDARLVRARADGTRRLYAIDESGLDAAHFWLAQLADPAGAFAQPLDALATEVARGKRAARRTGTAGTSRQEQRSA